jgi:2'-5' RNA ligase
LYLVPKTTINLKEIRDIFHKKYKREYVSDNNLTFIPHITIFKINDAEIYENHKINIEKIIETEINKLLNLNISLKTISLYAVNSNFQQEIQIKL